MWTEAHRARYDARLKEIVSLNAVAEVARWLERVAPPRSGRATPYGAVVRAIAWHLRVGGPWRALPPGGPPWRTGIRMVSQMAGAGAVFDRLLGDVARRRRRAMGRRAKPRLSIIDTQSVKSIPRCTGHVGTMPLRRCSGASAWPWLMPMAPGWPSRSSPASVQDRDTLEALDPGKAAWPSLREAILDGAFTAASCHEWSNRHGMRHRVVERDPSSERLCRARGPLGRGTQLRLACALGWTVAGSSWSSGRLRGTHRVRRRPVQHRGPTQPDASPRRRKLILNPLKQALRDH